MGEKNQSIKILGNSRNYTVWETWHIQEDNIQVDLEVADWIK
jgi:hypothetical protein